MEDQTLVVVGNGMVSFRLCQKLVACGAIEAGLRVVVFGEERRPAYDRIHLTSLFSGKRAEDLYLVPTPYYRANGIELYLGERITAIDRSECSVTTASGSTVLFDRLVLATGARAFVPPIPGTDLPGVFVYRTMDDVEAILSYRQGTRAAVLGGGLLGLEAAEAMRSMGYVVHVIEAAPRLMARQLDDTAAALLREKVEALGVAVRVGVSTTRIEAAGSEDQERALFLSDGSTLVVDVVILAAGVRPAGELARGAGIEVATNGGIVVDDHLATSDPRIFAVGDCATHRGTCYGLAAPGYQMVDVLVDNLVGGDATFTGSDASAKLKLLGVPVAALGQAKEEERPGSTVHVFRANSVYRKLVMYGGRIIGAIAVGDWEDLDRVRAALSEPRRVSYWDMRRFRGTGSLWLKSESPPVHEWPAEAVVCGCTGVRRGALTEAELAGCTTVEALSLATRAGTVCGSCKPLLADYLSRQRIDSLPPSRLETMRPAEDSPLTLRCSALPSSPALPRDLHEIATLAVGPILPPPMAQVATASGAPPAVTVEQEVLRSPRVSAISRYPSSAAPSLQPSLVEAPPASRQRPRRSPELDDSPESAPISSCTEPPISSRRESMPPLHPLSVAPMPGSTIPKGRLSKRPASVAPDGRTAAMPLFIAGIASLMGALGVSLARSLPPPTTVRGASLALLMDTHTTKLVSGYGILVLAGLSLLLSLRKRWAAFTLGSVQFFRALHAGLGAATLILISIHTGLHPGENLNRVLLIDVLALSLLGGVAAIVTARGGVSQKSQAQRLLATHAHLLLLLPTPVLVTLHMICVYYF